MKSISVDDPEYPPLLKSIKSPPERLYYEGEYDPEILENCVGVVGSRRLTLYGKKAAQKIVGELALLGSTVVSGFMYGADACSHRVALENGGKTIAVLPCGADIVHPENQKQLYEQILDNNGLIMSELPPGTPPQMWTYPRRNRIVAGLSRGVLIVEAGIQSGSLITADYARQFGRQIFVIPGSLFSDNFRGIYQLIKEGATVIDSGYEIAKFLGLFSPIYESNCDQPGLGLFDETSVEQSIVSALNSESLTLDELSRSLDVPAGELGYKLSLMQLSGAIYEDEGRYYVA